MRRLLILLSLFGLSVLGLTPAAAGSLPATPKWARTAVMYEVNVRQFSAEGDFAAVQAALPRLKSLGVTALWLMPIQPIGQVNRKGSLGSPYSVANYTQVNPDYGTSSDFKTLVTAAHSAGLKVIIDWVANHSAWDNPWLGAHKDWYTQDSQGDVIWPAGTDWNDVADFNYDNADLRTAMINAMKYWVQEFDIDGFRCDAAGMVPADFWLQARTALDAVKPLFMLAENSDNPDLLRQSFSANYNWPLLRVLNGLPSGQRSALDLDFTVQNSQSSMPESAMTLNFITNHDENSWNGTEYERMGAAVPAMTAIYFTVPGLPLIYNGQEVGLNRRLAFFEKDAINWASGTPNKLLADLAALKARNRALDAGYGAGAFTVLGSSDPHVVVYERAKAKDRVVLIANPTSKSLTVSNYVAPALGQYRDLATGTKVTLAKENTVMWLPANGFMVLDSQLGAAKTVTATSLKVAKSKITLKPKAKASIGLSISPAVLSDPRLTFKSSDPTVAKVFGLGGVVGLKAGKAVITVSLPGSKLTAKVAVTVV